MFQIFGHDHSFVGLCVRALGRAFCLWLTRLLLTDCFIVNGTNGISSVVAVYISTVYYHY